MAYVLWRVFMKKYTKVRLGIRNLPVNPAERQAPEKEETWTLASENHDQETVDEKKGASHSVVTPCDYEPNLPRSHETRKSKTKRVKNYLRKKCKDALSKSEDAAGAEKRRDQKCTSWYVDEKCSEEEFMRDHLDSSSLDRTADRRVCESVEKIQSRGSRSSLYEDATDVLLALDENVLAVPSLNSQETSRGLKPLPASSAETLVSDGVNLHCVLDKCESSDTLVPELLSTETTIVVAKYSSSRKSNDSSAIECGADCDAATFCESPDEDVPRDRTNRNNEAEVVAPSSLSIGEPVQHPILGGRYDVATLVKNLLGPIYGNGVLDLLTRQARDILVCAYHGNLDEFLKSFLSPAATLLAEVKEVAMKNGNESVVPKGWPLTLGEIGLVIHLGELEASALRVGECYLCARKPRGRSTDPSSNLVQEPVEIALVWRSSMRAPGILGWDREDEFMDWRDSHKRRTGASESVARPRRRSRDDLAQGDAPSDVEVVSNGARGEEPVRRRPDSADRIGRQPNLALAKSRSTSSVDSWQEEAKTERRRRPGDGVDVPRSEGARIKRGTSVSPMTVENWKESNSRWEPKTRTLAPRDLKTPFALEAVVAESEREKDASDHLQDLRPDAVSDEDLPGYIGTLLVSIERAIERVSIDDLPFPCPSCRHGDTDDPLLGCKCGSQSCGCSNDYCGCATNQPEESHTFEVAGIKHIDSDDEEEVRMGFGARKKGQDLTPPRSIIDLPDHLLTCGLTLPGYKDCADRPVIEYDSTVSPTEAISPVEIACFILYLVHLPSSDRSDTEFTLLVTGQPSEELDLLDNAFHLLQRTLRVSQALVLRNSCDEAPGRPLLPRSQIKVVFVDEETISKHISNRHQKTDHLQWISFFKEYDAVMSKWQAAGRKLAMAMSELKECAIIPQPLVPLSRLLTDPTVKRTPADANEVIALLEERSQNIRHVEQVRLSLDRARRLLTEVSNAATRLESSCESRRATIRNLTILRNIEDQAREVLSWLCKKGEETLSRHSRPSATNLPAAKIHERDFEKFYFTSMKHLDKGSDLAEAANTSGLRELARSLKQHLRGFGSRLEDTRERLEDTSRCFLLLDRAYEWALEATRVVGDRRAQQFLMARPPLPQEHFAEMVTLAEKLGNESLLEQCRVARNRCAEALELTRSQSAPGSPARRRSFAATGSAASWDDSLTKRTSWDDSDSASCSCPVDGGVGSGSGNGGRPALDNIAELRESAEQLLDSSPPRSPPRSPAPRRLAKPPVNSHLHRAPSIAPGMKAKKTILLIMREMIQTERDYVKSLEYIIENYIPELVREDIPQALRGQRNVIFGNVEKIYEFHSQHFLRELEQCEQCPMFVGQCFIRHEKKFYLYALYNKNKPNSDSLMAEYGTAFFKTKQLELGDKMDLASYLLKPVQRMGKYALLLQQLVKAGTDLSDQIANKDEKEDKEDKEEEPKPLVEGEADLRAAEQMVRFQLRHGNDLLAMDSLRDCDVNVKEQGRLLRQNEFLVWQGKGKKCLRQVFLFEDLILFSKARRFPDRKNLDIYIYKNSIKTTDIGLTAVIADSPTKFEIWFRKRKPGDTYTLQCANEDIKKTWTEELSNLLWKQALRNREVRLAEMSSMGIGNKPCLDIRPSADQINDRSISVAQLSKTPRFRNSIAVSVSEDSGRCSRRPHSVISVSSSSSSGGSSGPTATLHLGLDTSPRPHHRSTTLNSQCSVESGIIADISIVSDDGGEGTERNHWNSSLESPTSHLPATSTPLQSPTNATSVPVTMQPSVSDSNLTPYDQDISINL
ncbi:pleckstrin homology domain-containing family G member 4B isoform X1 [Neodiprion pinetum]|uniref:pleckstrin homology domain-containing family G member 4B isoform X1 n=1 Tax=Neodiprion pinetum TaxID=441929 RepID=UPI001EDE9D9C|nr:uncharacterized protein LOC124213094 [Neodiprion pinetum]